MTSLEFIEKEIKSTERRLQGLRTDQSYAISHNREDEFLDLDSDIEYYENLLNHLLQIKAELEAWEVVKHLIYERKMGKERYIQVMGGAYNEGQCWSSGINPYERIKKALEVENDR